MSQDGLEHRVRELAQEIVDRLWPMCSHYGADELLTLATKMAATRLQFAERGPTAQPR